MPGFVYAQVRWAGSRTRPEIWAHLRAREGSRGICSTCFQKRPGYDVLNSRHFAFVPLWGLAVFLVYAMRRVDCPRCGVTVEAVPWASGKMQTTHALTWFLASWAKVLSWKETARRFRTSWDTVFRSVEHAVRWGLAHRSLDGIRSIGVDELAWKKGHKYLTLVYQLDHGCRRLLHIARTRKATAFETFFDMLGEERSQAIVFVASDMWKAFLKVVRKRCSTAVHVLDRFHVVQLLSKAIDTVRREEVRSLRAAGRPAHLTKARWVLLKHRKNRTHDERGKLRQLVRAQLALGPRVPARRAVPPLLEVPVQPSRPTLPCPVDVHGHALAAGALQEVRAHASGPPARASQLVRRSGTLRSRGYRGIQQQGSRHDPKSLRLSNLRTRRDRPVSRARRPTRARLARPQILLRRRKIESSAIPDGSV